MPLLRRRKPDVDAVAVAVVERLEKAGLALPAGSSTQTYTSAELQGMMSALSQIGGFDALPRNPALTVPFGPLNPLVPAPIDPRLPSGRTEPRRSQYPVGWNLPGGDAPNLPPFDVLRKIADRVPVVRRCIEVRKQQITSLSWDFRISDAAIERRMADTGITSKGQVSTQLRNEMAKPMADLRTFWERPDRMNGLWFADWVSTVLEEMFVVDAVCIYPHMNRGGQLHSFRIIAGDTIKPLLDNYGNVPQPPEAAYQQYLYGFPRGEFTRTDDDASSQFRADQLMYRTRARYTWKPYGYSSVEQALPEIDLHMKRTEWLRAEYTDGATPDLFLKVPPNWSPDQILQYEQVLNDELSGQPQQRRHIRLLPDLDPFQPQSSDHRYSEEIDEHFIKRICMCFDMMPSELGFLPRGGLGGKGMAEGAESTTYRKGIRPTVIWLQALVNEASRTYLGMPDEIEFAFIGYEIEDQFQMAKTFDTQVRGGFATINDVNQQLGRPLYDFPEADEPFVVVGSGVTFLRGAIEAQSRMLEAQVGGQDTGQGPDVARATPPAQTSDRPAAPAAQAPSASPPSPPANNTSRRPQQKTEVATFKRFAAKRYQSGTWRDFTFTTLERGVAARMNGVAKVRVAHASKLAAAVRSVLPSKAELDNISTKAMRPDVAHVLATVKSMSGSPDPVVGVIRDVRRQGFGVGFQSFDDTATADDVPDEQSSGRLGRLVAGAGALAGIYLAGQQLLLARAVANGDDPSDILDDSTWAGAAVDLDAARAASVGESVAASIAGFISKTYQADDGECAMCAEADGESTDIDTDFKFGDPPLHDNCGCDVQYTGGDDSDKAIGKDDDVSEVVDKVKGLPSVGDANHIAPLWDRYQGPDALPDPTDPVWDEAKCRVVKIDDLLASTKRLKRDDLIAHVKQPGVSRSKEQDRIYPLVAQTDDGDVIVDGHHRLAALRLRGDKRAPVYRLKV